MSLLDVKYVVTVEYIDDINKVDAMSYYATDSTTAAALCESFKRKGTVMAVTKRVLSRTDLVECSVRTVIYAPI